MKHHDFLISLKKLKNQCSIEEKKERYSFLSHKVLQVQEVQPYTTYCSCKGKDGEVKYLYSTQKELEYLLLNKEIKLYTYPCPDEPGWHLSKDSF